MLTPALPWHPSENLSVLNEFSVPLCEAGIISVILQTSR